MREQHPFSKFIAILARGKTKTRPLTLDESREAMGMLLRGETEPEQVGAFLMLMRLKEETPEEIAGMALAVRDLVKLPENAVKVDIDWSSYAGKRRQLPWYILSALLLASNGYKLVMHGTEGHTPGRIYSRECLESLGIKVAGSYDEANAHVLQSNFAYIPLEIISPRLKDMIELRPVLGLRSPVHSFARMINPFNAGVMVNGIFHRGFMGTHTGAAQYMKQPHMCVFRGDGGEVERRPGKTCEVWSVHEGEVLQERWPAIIDDPRAPADEDMDISHLAGLWRGEISSSYGEAAVCATLAVVLRTMGVAGSIEQAETDARAMWNGRDRTSLPVTA